MKISCNLVVLLALASVIALLLYVAQIDENEPSVSKVKDRFVIGRQSIAKHFEKKINTSLSYSSSGLLKTQTNVTRLENTRNKNANGLHYQYISNDGVSCHTEFPTKCNMYPYVRFWDKQMRRSDCYDSPAKHPLKRDAPISELKFGS